MLYALATSSSNSGWRSFLDEVSAMAKDGQEHARLASTDYQQVEAQLVTRSSAADARDTELDQKAAEVGRAVQALDERTAEVDRAEQALSTERAALTQAKAAVERMRAEAEKHAQSLTERAQGLDARCQELDARKLSLNDEGQKYHDLALRQKTLEQQEADLKAKQRTHEQVRGQYRQRAEQMITIAKQDMASSKANLDAARAVGTQSQKLVNEVRAKEVAFSTDLGDLQKQVTSLETQLEQLRRDNATLHADNRQLMQGIEGQTKETAQTVHETRPMVEATLGTLHKDFRPALERQWNRLAQLPMEQPATVAAISMGVREMIIPLLETVVRHSTQDAVDVVKHLLVSLGAASQAVVQHVGHQVGEQVRPIHEGLAFLRQSMDVTAEVVRPLRRLQQMHIELQRMMHSMEQTHERMGSIMPAMAAQTAALTDTQAHFLEQFSAEAAELQRKAGGFVSGQQIDNIAVNVDAMQMTLTMIQSTMEAQPVEVGAPSTGHQTPGFPPSLGQSSGQSENRPSSSHSTDTDAMSISQETPDPRLPMA